MIYHALFLPTAHKAPAALTITALLNTYRALPDRMGADLACIIDVKEDDDQQTLGRAPIGLQDGVIMEDVAIDGYNTRH